MINQHTNTAYGKSDGSDRTVLQQRVLEHVGSHENAFVAWLSPDEPGRAHAAFSSMCRFLDRCERLREFPSHAVRMNQAELHITLVLSANNVAHIVFFPRWASLRGLGATLIIREDHPEDHPQGKAPEWREELASAIRIYMRTLLEAGFEAQFVLEKGYEAAWHQVCSLNAQGIEDKQQAAEMVRTAARALGIDRDAFRAAMNASSQNVQWVSW